MTRRPCALVALLLASCGPYDGVDAACPEGLPGDRLVAEDDAAMFLRFSCYRRYVGLPRLPFARGVQQAVQSHVTYLDENGILDPDSPNYFLVGNPRGDTTPLFVQDPKLPFFTGASVSDRLLRFQALDTNARADVWDIFFGSTDEGDYDALIADPYFRDVVFQPLVAGVGFASFGVGQEVFAYANVLYAFPSNARTDRPVVYPRDGQLDVPTSYVPYATSLDPIAVRDVVGYPITITVGSYEGNRTENPYDLLFVSSSLIGPEGEEVELVRAGPAQYPWGPLQATLIAVPTAPLLPDSTYEFEAEIRWNVRQRKRVRTVFSTAPADG